MSRVAGFEQQPSTPRVRLRSASNKELPLNGAWWPRSDDPVAELPGLVMALDELGDGQVTRLVLHRPSWSSFPARLTVAGRVVTVGYFTTQPLNLLIAMRDSYGWRLDLLTIPPGTPEDVAELAMERASAEDNAVPAQFMLSGIEASKQ
ncbi:hypothetical protein E1263_05105 [Kribbella antibiotica]|uniref:Uncharacterized protein n=1 Tax=Kribbella antibiotica TaxID=190195 RepID=A0A4V2YQG4_9ACTN|nr:DUF5994 family protein [Kribbella antibiotica]TDD61997.1 hypothetical protein E1263_05105 [Kribbella antibiotica]